MYNQILSTIYIYIYMTNFVGPQGAVKNAMEGSLRQDTVIMVNPNEVYQDKILVSTADGSSKIGAENEVAYVASVGKVLTAKTAFEFFKDKGGVDAKLCDIVEKYNIESEFIEKNLKNLPHYKDITIANLLNHTSGLPQFSQDGFNELTRKNDKMLSSEQILSHSLDKNGEFGKQNYSNVGYELLGLIMEKTSGKTLESLQRDLVLKPLKLEKEIFLRDDIKKENGEYEITGKELLLGRHFDGKEEKELPNLSHHAGAGMYANPKSIAKLAKGIWTDDFLKECEKYEVEIGGGAKYGIGYIRNGDFINHDGGMDGTRSSVMLDLKSGKVACAVATLEDKSPKLAPKIDEIGPEAHYEEIKKVRGNAKKEEYKPRTLMVKDVNKCVEEKSKPSYAKPTISSLLKEGKDEEALECGKEQKSQKSFAEALKNKIQTQDISK